MSEKMLDYKEMLEMFIELTIESINRYGKMANKKEIELMEKATGKTWKEITR